MPEEHCRDGTTPSTSTDYESNIVMTDAVYAVVRNIPKKFHSKDLRRYFAEYVENGYFKCFHYRHRPEIQIQKNDETSGVAEVCCCLVSFNAEKLRRNFKNDFHLKFWSDLEGNDMPSRCYIFNVKLDAASKAEGDLLSKQDLSAMIEFRPPTMMPFGNVGTPSVYFLEQIRLCKLPASLIGKLGLRPMKRVGRYGAVPFTYPRGVFIHHSQLRVEDEREPRQKVFRSSVLEREENKIPEDLSPEEKISLAKEPDNDDGEDDDDDQCEEWERHEALHDDITEQDRTKPKKYEEELEVVWEKGGPGLVWYTDTFYWNETEQGTDTDWKWADDWDVDYSVYYDKPGCSLDAKQAVEIREDEKLRAGELTLSVFRKKSEKEFRKRRYSDSETDRLPFGGFEKHTKGIGSKLLIRYGWKPGRGLGRDESGKAETVSIEMEETGSSQRSGQRTGFGYHGERLQRTGFGKTEDHTITTIYDIQRAKMNGRIPFEDSRDPVLRSKDSTFMKYR